MVVNFITTTSAKINDLPINNGNIIVISDENKLLYDMGGVRHEIQNADLTNFTLFHDEELNQLQLKLDSNILSSITTYSVATDSTDGLFSSEDKTKLDGIASNANNYTHPSSAAGAKSSGLYKVATDANGHVTSATNVTKADITGLGIPGEMPSIPSSLPADGGNADTVGNKSVQQIKEYIESVGMSCVGKQNFISYPEGGVYISGTGELSATGFLKIILPQLWTNTMIKFTVSIFNYVNNACVDYIISGRNYNSESKWYKCTALCIGKYGESLSNLPVNFGYIGDKAAVAIGYADTVWRFPQVVVHDVIVGYNNYEYEKWSAGWQISIDATNITVAQDQGAVTNTNVAYNSHNSDTVDGFHASQGNVANTAVVRDANGYTQLGYINSGTANDENPAVSQIVVTNGSDNYYRKASLQHLKSGMGFEWVKGKRFSNDVHLNANAARQYVRIITISPGVFIPKENGNAPLVFNVLSDKHYKHLQRVFVVGRVGESGTNKLVLETAKGGNTGYNVYVRFTWITLGADSAYTMDIYLECGNEEQRICVDGTFVPFCPLSFPNEELSSLPSGSLKATEVSYIP